MATATKRAKASSAEGDAHLSHLIPEKMFEDEYVARKIENVWDVDILRYAHAARNNTLLFGPTGPGKTSLVLAYAAADQKPVVTIQCNGAVDPNTFWGGLAFDENGILQGWQDSEITLAIRHGGIIYLDEVNFLPPKVAAVFHGLLDKRRQITIPEKGNEVVKAHDDLQIIAAYNPDYEGTKPLNAAFKNRFKIKLRFDYDEAVEKELVCIPVMLDIAKKLRIAHKGGDLDTPTSTNMLIEFEELAVDLGYDFAVNNFLNAFAEEERASVTEAFDMYSTEIKKQVKQMEELAASS
jgi:nitric oxide reductase NorQ protein